MTAAIPIPRHRGVPLRGPAPGPTPTMRDSRWADQHLTRSLGSRGRVVSRAEGKMGEEQDRGTGHSDRRERFVRCGPHIILPSAANPRVPSGAVGRPEGYAADAGHTFAPCQSERGEGSAVPWYGFLTQPALTSECV